MQSNWKARIIRESMYVCVRMASIAGLIRQGLMVAHHTSLASDFKVVRSVKPNRRYHTIKINEPFANNQVYTTKEDFDFVLDYILQHCPRVKK